MVNKSTPAVFAFLLCYSVSLHLIGAATVVRETNGLCPIYGYVRGFTLTEVSHESYMLDEAFCEGLSQPHAGQPTQCRTVVRTLRSDSDNWNECPKGFYLQSIDQKQMVCCKPSSHPYRYNGCSDVSVVSNSHEVRCPSGYIVAKIKVRQCGSLVCTSEISCCRISDEPSPVTNFDDVKARVMDDTQVPLSLLAHFLGFGWCGGCDGRYVGECMGKSGDKWISSTSDSCPGPKGNERLEITYSDFNFKQTPSKQEFYKASHTELKPEVVLTGEFINNDTHSNTFTVGREITRTHTVTHTRVSSFTLSHISEFQVTFKSFFLGGTEYSVKYGLGHDTTEEDIKGTEDSESSTIKYGSEVTLGPCSAVGYNIFLASTRVTQYYNVFIDVSYSANLEGFLRYGGGAGGSYTNFHKQYRGSGSRSKYQYTFGSSTKSLHDDLQEQRDSSEHWEWKNMKDRYKNAPILIDILTDQTRHEFHLTGKFEETAGHTAYIVFNWKQPPAGCKRPEKVVRSAYNRGLAPSSTARLASQPRIHESSSVITENTASIPTSKSTSSLDTSETTSIPTPEATSVPTPKPTSSLDTSKTTSVPTPETTSFPTPQTTSNLHTPETTSIPTPETTSRRDSPETTFSLLTLETSRPTPETTSSLDTPETTSIPTPETTSSLNTPKTTSSLDIPETTSIPTLETTSSLDTPETTSSLDTPETTSSLDTPETTSSLDTPGTTSSLDTPETTSGLDAQETTSILDAPETTFSLNTPETTSSLDTPESTSSLDTLEAISSLDTQETTSSPTTLRTTSGTNTQKTTSSPDEAGTRSTTIMPTTITDAHSQITTSTPFPQYTTEQPEINFLENFVRRIDLENGAFTDEADIDIDNITEAGEDPPEETVENQIIYFFPNGTKNPNFNFSSFFDALDDDKLMAGSSAVKYHLFLIVVAVFVVFYGW